MTTTATTEHTCHGAVFCGQPRAAAQAACTACTPPAPARPLLEVLREHTEKIRTARELEAGRGAARRQALEQLAGHALPADAPGAWIRNAIDQELANDVAAGRACGDHDRPTPCSECQ